MFPFWWSIGQYENAVAPSPIHSHMGMVPPSSAPAIHAESRSPLASTQMGHTRKRPPAAWYRAMRSVSGGQPVHAAPVATPSIARRTASLVRNINVGLPDSAAPHSHEEGDGDALGVFETGGERNNCLAGHGAASFIRVNEAMFCPVATGVNFGFRTTAIHPVDYGSGMFSYGQFCPVAKTSELLCERWVPLILREIMCGSERFNEIRRGIPLISTAMLSMRLKQLADSGVIVREPEGRGCTYRPSEAGWELYPIIEAMGVWGQRWARSTYTEDELDPSLLM